ncbi:MAG: hypothetical protein KME19_04625 [Microcoleus vaginatus WJT46-NPBG5]|jgi:hypothetical protein|nr:hypothetical protein [Microcoleus vaginatus WJT46-NPBG5]
MKLPNPEQAIIDEDKLSGYCLNLRHSEGQHKARVFQSVLGIGIEEADELRAALLQAIQTTDAVLAQPSPYGHKYKVDFLMARQDKSAIVRSIWIVRNNEDFPRLITCFVL